LFVVSAGTSWRSAESEAAAGEAGESIAPRVRRRHDLLLLVGGSAALVVLFTWPLASNPSGYARLDSADGQYSVWNVGWVAHALTTRGTTILDANIFHPHRATLAFSELNIGAGTLGLPIYLITGSAVAAHNAAVLAGLWLSLIGTALLVWRLTRSRPAACVAAVLFTFCPYLYSHTTHVQLMMTFGLPWTLLALHRFAEAPSWWRAAALGAALGVLALCCGYYGVLGAFLVGLGCLYTGITRRRIGRPLWWAQVSAAALTSLLVVLPFFVPFLELQRETGFARSMDEAYYYAADWRAYLASSAWGHRWMLRHIGRYSEVLFPGFVALAFAVVGVVRGGRRDGGSGDSSAPTGRREAVGFYALAAVLAFWISLGPRAGLYALLYKTVPAFSLLRAPGRFGIGVALSLAVLAGFGVAALTHGGSWRRRVAGAALCVVAGLELWTAWPARRVPPVPAAYLTLARLPPGPVVALPFFWSPPDFSRHAYYMFTSTYHWYPLVNGYSDHIPADFRGLASVVSRFPSRESFDVLRPRGARYVLFHPQIYRAGRLQDARAGLEKFRPFLKGHVVEGDVWLYEILAWPE
jgi:hypothetical protein